MKKLTTEEFITKANIIHNGKYDYSKVKYVNARTKVTIVCKVHGDFEQKPNTHLNGCGCPKCSNNSAKSLVEFIDDSNKVHDNRYDYSKVTYINNKTKVCIICKEHGEFWQTPTDHLSGHGCPYCTNNLKYDTEQWILKAKEVHNNVYDYSKVNYINSKTKVCIICKEHGEFWQTPTEHLRGHGCPLCAIKRGTNTVTEFITKANIVHNGKYDYSSVQYVNNRTPIDINCLTHGFFKQLPHVHLEGCGCPKCNHTASNSEVDICEILTPLEVIERDRTVLTGKEIDIYIPSIKVGIEYNGLRWHSEIFGKDKQYHFNKLIECNKKGVKLIQIFEDEWINHREICESKLKQICNLNNNTSIYARKCNIVRIDDKKTVYDFLEKNHIQGKTGFTIAIGAYFNDKLIGVMTFKKEKNNIWDLNRFATDINYRCVGVGGKLFKYFTRNYDYKEIKSFADRRWTMSSTDNLYTKLGFELQKCIPPTYWYYNPQLNKYKRIHRFNLRKQLLHQKYKLPLSMTELEMTKRLGYTRIWDCGLFKYIFKKEI